VPLFTQFAHAGTAALVADIHPGPGDSQPAFLAVYNDKLYFSGYDLVHNYELWSYDGAGSPSLVADINPNAGSNPRHLTVFNGKLYFQAFDSNGTELWVYDGVNPPTMLADINPTSRSGPDNLMVFRSRLYFSADDGIFISVAGPGSLNRWPANQSARLTGR